MKLALFGKQPKQETSVNMLLKIVVQFGLISFLATSIPHVAWIYHEFETGANSTLVNLLFTQTDTLWFNSYAIAIGIDVTIACLSEMAMRGVNRSVLVTFVILLSMLSQFSNYLYDMAHRPLSMPYVNIWSIDLSFWFVHTTTGTITPIILSCLPLFVIAYTFMLYIINGSKKVSPDELAKQANELQLRNEQKARINQLKREAFITSITGMVGASKQAVSQSIAIALSNTQVPDTQVTQIDTPAIPEHIQPTEQETTTDKIQTVKEIDTGALQPVVVNSTEHNVTDFFRSIKQ